MELLIPNIFKENGIAYEPDTEVEQTTASIIMTNINNYYPHATSVMIPIKSYYTYNNYTYCIYFDKLYIESNPKCISPDMISHESSNPDKISPDKISPDKISPDMISHENISPDMISPDMISPDKISHESSNPDKISPDKISPDKISPDKICTVISFETLISINVSNNHSVSSPRTFIQDSEHVKHCTRYVRYTLKPDFFRNDEGMMIKYFSYTFES
ncbi:hypothetical protein TRFO_35601 [Tritrichomonas foetus]|uniref:Uncharacterized protein n=1 Tax=Tritrichomonas foetus TaxID=1144522 RepID=A0A1J4JKI3_9EUKA|nr:hypothetical protein TRFO_35601 [Tritrichomonas foetus]|eukprot:OHS98067.1 hypothetical protein TRFO_35601 [Tritrichomonas foetus]